MDTEAELQVVDKYSWVYGAIYGSIYDVAKACKTSSSQPPIKGNGDEKDKIFKRRMLVQKFRQVPRAMSSGLDVVFN